MRRFLVLLLAVAAARGALAADRLIPVITGTIGDRTYRTTVDLRSPTTEECRFEFRAPDGATLHAVEPVEAGRPKLLNAFASGLPAGATTIRVSCTGEVEAHSLIHESGDGGVTFDEGPLFEADLPEPLAAGQKHAMPVTGDFILAEVHGAPVRVVATLTATSSGRIAEKQYELAPFEERSIGMTDVLLSLGAIDATFEIEGEGHVIVLAEVIDPAFANRAHRASQLNAQTDAPPGILSSTFKAAPFSDPATGLVYLRNRWYDPGTGTFLSPDPMGYQDSSNLYAFAGEDPVNGRDPTGECLGIDKAGKPCGDYARMLPDFLVDVLGLNDLPSTGRKKLDQSIRKIAQAPVRVAAVPATTLLATGDSSGQVAYRMERSTFYGEQPRDPASVDEALLVAGTMADVATVVAPIAMLKGGPELIGNRESQRGSVFIKGRKPRQAEDLVRWVDEGGELRVGASPGMRPQAYRHQSGAPGARSNVLTGRSQAPYLEFTDPAGNVIGAKFDGVQGSELIDRKLNPFFSAKAVDQARRQIAIAQHYGLRTVWELPTRESLQAAERFLKTNNINGITVRLTIP